jgi:hypothetical protein
MARHKVSKNRLVEDGKPVRGLPKRDYIAIVAEMIRAEPTLERFPAAAIIYFVKARHLPIEPQRILACASLLAAAELKEEHYLPPGKTVSVFPYQSVATWFGIPWNQADPDEISALYRNARQAMQQVDAATTAAQKKGKRLLEVLQRHNDALPVQLRPFRGQLLQHLDALSKFNALLSICQYRDVDPPMRNLLKWTRKKESNERLNVQQQALIWWWLYHRRQHQPIWPDLFSLARIWHLTSCKDPDHLKRVVLKLAAGVTKPEPPPQWVSKALSLRK